MDIRKNMAYPFANASDAIAGPGQNPTNPQPTPNKEEPAINLLSTIFVFGIENISANNGLFLFLNKKKNGALVKIAPIMTNISDGSHWPKKFKKPSTLAGLIIFDMANPTPNIIPLISDIILDILFYPNYCNCKNCCNHK